MSDSHHSTTESPAPAPDLSWALAGLSAGAGVIHLVMAPVHASTGWEEPLGFALAGWFQLLVAASVLTGRASRNILIASVVGNIVLVGLWLWSRTVGLPFGASSGAAEPVGAIDATCVALQLIAVGVGLRLLITPNPAPAGRLAPALAAVAALGLVTAVITSPDASQHGHEDEDGSAASEIAAIDASRCDRELNPDAYWAEAAYLGVDTTYGGDPPAPATGSSDGHDHAGGATAGSDASTTSTAPDPNGGRGSAALDRLVSGTSLASTSEDEASKVIESLSEASDGDYEDWLWWMRASEQLSHDHAAAPSTDPNAPTTSGHGGHLGPQPWVAITDQAECDRLADELELARDTALAVPTAADAIEAGYELTTTYAAGIGAHYIRYDLIDDTFEIERPEMILYDGDGPDAHVVGLSYYLWHPGDATPTQGFTGDNDHTHRHIGLCDSPDGVVIGDSSLTAEECEAIGGVKSDGSDGWMSHAWVVPGCESPWGVFSAASPLLDGDLTRAGPDGGPGCAGSGVRARYDLADPPASRVTPAESGIGG